VNTDLIIVDLVHESTDVFHVPVLALQQASRPPTSRSSSQASSHQGGESLQHFVRTDAPVPVLVEELPHALCDRAGNL